jgi:hypothetical protein
MAVFLIGWATILIAFALFLGLLNLLRVHLSKIQNRQPGRSYSLVLIIALVSTLLIGRGGPNTTGGQAIFEYVLRPLEATLFALMAFFVFSAAFRAFRIRNFETFLFVAFASIVLLGQVPAGFQLGQALASLDFSGSQPLAFLADLPLIKEWIMRVPALAGTRGILLGVALGTIATGLRILMGIDRPYADVQQD